MTVTLAAGVKSDHASRSSRPDGRHVGFPGSASRRTTIAIDSPPFAKHCQPSERVRAARPSTMDSQPRKSKAPSKARTVASTRESPTTSIRHIPSAGSQGTNSGSSSLVNASAASAGDPKPESRRGPEPGREHALTTAMTRHSAMIDRSHDAPTAVRRTRVCDGNFTASTTYSYRHRTTSGSS